MQPDGKTSAKFPPEFQTEAGRISAFRAFYRDAETENPADRRTPDTKSASVIVLHLTPAPGNYQAPPEKRLARLLKCMLRAYGWRCVACRPVTPANFRGNDAAAKERANG